MSFLAPLFLLGALAVALPIVFHLIRRATRERTIFSSLMFLLPTPPRLTHRSRLEHLLLLLLRCLVLCLLAFGFARPFIKKAISKESPSDIGRRLALLVDTSASMRRSSLWADAREKVDEILRKTSPADEAGLFTFDRTVTPIIGFEQWNVMSRTGRTALIKAKMSQLTPGWAGTHLGAALIEVAEALADTKGKAVTGPRQIVLITDLQEGSHLEQLQGYEWPKGIDLSVELVKPRQPGNAGLQLLNDSEEEAPKSEGRVRVRVSNSSDSRRDQFKLGWMHAGSQTFLGQPVDVYVPSGQSRIAALPPLKDAVADRIVLKGDEQDFDNAVFVVPPQRGRITVVYLGGDSEKDPKQPLFFLRRAFQETQRQAVEVLARPSPSSVSRAELEQAALLVATDPLPDNLVDQVRAQITAGKTLLLVLKSTASTPEAVGDRSAVNLAPTLARLLQLPRLTVEDARLASYAMLGEIDFRHPLFAPFADPRFSDFTKIHFWKYRRLDVAAIPAARVVASFDNGDPALLEMPIGKGRLLLLTSSWQPEDSQLALSTKFVPFLYALLEQAGAVTPLPTDYHVGDSIPLTTLPGAGASFAPAVSTGRGEELHLITPDGSQFVIGAGETNFSQTLTPGIYNVTSGGSVRSFAVNPDPNESRTAPLSLDELERFGAPLAHSTPGIALTTQRNIHLQNAELEDRQKLWRWVIILTLAALLFETWLAGRTARRLA